MDFAKLAQQNESIEAAQRGSFKLIADRLERNEISEQERQWLAKELRGEHKVPKGRKKASQSRNGRGIKDQFEDNSHIDLAVWDAVTRLVLIDELPPAKARELVAEILGECERTVRERIGRVEAHKKAGGDRASYLADETAGRMERWLGNFWLPALLDPRILRERRK